MNREAVLRDLLEITLELPDEELRKLGRLADYLKETQEGRIKGATTEDPLLDLILGTFRLFAEERGSLLHAIYFTEKGVAIEWHEEERAGKRPSRGRYKSESEWIDALREWHKTGLAVYGYRLSLSEVISKEWERLEEKEKK